MYEKNTEYSFSNFYFCAIIAVQNMLAMIIV